MAGRSALVTGIARWLRPVCDGRGSGSWTPGGCGRAERAGGAAGADFNCWRSQPGS